MEKRRYGNSFVFLFYFSFSVCNRPKLAQLGGLIRITFYFLLDWVLYLSISSFFLKSGINKILTQKCPNICP